MALILSRNYHLAVRRWLLICLRRFLFCLCFVYGEPVREADSNWIDDIGQSVRMFFSCL